jgi:AraC-like DNA-binding protein
MINKERSSNPFFDRKGDHVIDREGRDVLSIAHDEGFMVGEVAKRFGMSVKDFEMALDKVVGMKPKNFFRQYRAVVARRMMREGHNLHTIAEDLGFRHYSHFSTEMKGFYGIPPLKLQKVIQARCSPRRGASQQKDSR